MADKDSILPLVIIGGIALLLGKPKYDAFDATIDKTISEWQGTLIGDETILGAGFEGLVAGDLITSGPYAGETYLGIVGGLPTVAPTYATGSVGSVGGIATISSE